MWDQQQWDTSAEVQIRVNVRYHPCVWPPPQKNSEARPVLHAGRETMSLSGLLWPKPEHSFR